MALGLPNSTDVTQDMGYFSNFQDSLQPMHTPTQQKEYTYQEPQKQCGNQIETGELD